MKKLLAFIFLSIVCVSCRKEPAASSTTSGSNFTGCRVDSIVIPPLSVGDNSIYTFTYNSDGTVASVRSKEGNDVFVRSYVYKTNCIIVNTTDQGEPYGRDSVVTDAQNRVVYISHYEYNGSPPDDNSVYETYEYDSFGTMAVVTSHSYSSVSSTVYEWKNGDIQRQTSGTDFYQFEHDTANYITANLPTDIDDLINYGRGILSSKHFLSRSTFDSLDDYTYNNIADASGKLVSIQQIYSGNGFTRTTTIGYECH